ncbi:valine--tRNA ligase [Ureaplasma canigenitalium]|uniref:valine--tRNA ligase n=1 Tax=Ureaplasma canigenitalium TaxID=42092 RepID=UPI0004E0FE99|nr:valine--tRNA ligase [Ureaplasma canigenitalium]
MEKKYNHKQMSLNKVDLWTNLKLFSPDIDSDKPPFVITLPPPNVTGHLHIGHAYGFSLPDLLVRYKKLKGYDAFIIPGSDHAGIATQTKFEKVLKETKNLRKDDLPKEEFLRLLSNWKNEQEEYIKKQFKGIGLAFDYHHYLFTLDQYVRDQVKKIFVKMYDDGLIYRALKLVNWDIKLKTAISNIEVIHKDVNQKLYHIKYFTEDQKNFVIVATTRPETMFGDRYLVVNPTDQRYQNIHDKIFINPVNGERMKVILDDYIDITFGTGVMKCTPAHDFNDDLLAKKHHLEYINIMNEDGTLNEYAGKYKGLDRLVARKNIVEELEANGYIVKIEETVSPVGFSERTDEVVEPYLSTQWFIKMDNLKKETINIQKNEKKKANFYPNRFDTQLLNFLENTDDWCISRQLVWGHEIPAWHHKVTKEVYVGVNPPADIENYIKDESVLDTWFSSGIWPLFCSKYMKDDKFFHRYFPNQCMVTGSDILFFWVSRMLNFSVYLTGQKPFNDILIHGLIRDSIGRKMSKSLNNGVDPFDIIEQHGLDSMRWFFYSSSTIGEDLNYNEEKIRSASNFMNKFYNIALFVNENTSNEDQFQFDQIKHPINAYILNRFQSIYETISYNLDKYNINVATKIFYDFVYDDFASFYLELTKILNLDDQYQKETRATLRFVFLQMLILFHPFCPMITEELYLNIFKIKDSILLHSYPSYQTLPVSSFPLDLKELITKIRVLRKEQDISNKVQLIFSFKDDEIMNDNILSLYNQLLKIVNAVLTTEPIKNSNLELIFKGIKLKTFYEKNINIDELKQRLVDRLKVVEAEIERANALLLNQNFINKAKDFLIKKEKDKLSSYEKERETLLSSIKEYEK